MIVLNDPMLAMASGLMRVALAQYRMLTVEQRGALLDQFATRYGISEGALVELVNALERLEGEQLS